MPTASTAQILGNNESIEAYTSNIYVRRVLSGEFQVLFFNLYFPKDRKFDVVTLGCESPFTSRSYRRRFVEWKREKWYHSE